VAVYGMCGTRCEACSGGCAAELEWGRSGTQTECAGHPLKVMNRVVWKFGAGRRPQQDPACGEDRHQRHRARQLHSPRHLSVILKSRADCEGANRIDELVAFFKARRMDRTGQQIRCWMRRGEAFVITGVAGLRLVAAGVALLAVSSSSLSPYRSALLDLPCTLLAKSL